MRVMTNTEYLLEMGRKRKGIIATDFSKVMFGSVNTWYNRRQDLSRLSVGELLRICDFLNIDPEEVFQTMRKEIQ